jgi:hypothetical protein
LRRELKEPLVTALIDVLAKMKRDSEKDAYIEEAWMLKENKVLDRHNQL